MPDDDFDDGGRQAGQKNRRDLAIGANAGGQKKRGQQGAQAERQVPISEPVNPIPALPTGTAHQVELLLARRQHRLRNLLIRLGIVVALPTLVVWFYAALIATPRYVCNFEITYQAYQPSATLAGSLTQSELGSSVVDNVDYGTLLYEYIRSQALAEKIDGQIGLRSHFESNRIDSLSRLSPHASQPAFLAYWQSHVVVEEGFGGYLTVQVQGFDAAYTLLLAQTISQDADDMINGLSTQALASGVQSAKSQLTIAGQLLKKADDTLTIFRNSHGDLDPSLAATELATIVGALETELASLNAQLQWSEANLQPNSSQIVQLKLQVAATQQQIKSERERLSSGGGSTYSNTVSEYDDLVTDQQFASTTYQAAQQGLIIAQANAAGKQNYAVAFVPPVYPDHPTLPDATSSALKTFLVFLAIYGICNLLFSAFRDQSGI